MSKGKVLTKKDCRTAAKRWLIGISTFNYETQLAPSYAFAVYPLLRKMYPDDEDFKASLLNAMRYYNTMPWISPGNKPPAIDNPVVNQVGMKSKIALTIDGPIATHKNTGTAEHKP